MRVPAHIGDHKTLSHSHGSTALPLSTPRGGSLTTPSVTALKGSMPKRGGSLSIPSVTASGLMRPEDVVMTPPTVVRAVSEVKTPSPPMVFRAISAPQVFPRAGASGVQPHASPGVTPRNSFRKFTGVPMCLPSPARGRVSRQGSNESSGLEGARYPEIRMAIKYDSVDKLQEHPGSALASPILEERRVVTNALLDKQKDLQGPSTWTRRLISDTSTEKQDSKRPTWTTACRETPHAKPEQVPIYLPSNAKAKDSIQVPIQGYNYDSARPKEVEALEQAVGQVEDSALPRSRGESRSLEAPLPRLRGESRSLEAPVALKDMGSWMASVYSIEQQHRLSVDERGSPSQVKACAMDSKETVIRRYVQTEAHPAPFPKSPAMDSRRTPSPKPAPQLESGRTPSKGKPIRLVSKSSSKETLEKGNGEMNQVLADGKLTDEAFIQELRRQSDQLQHLLENLDMGEYIEQWTELIDKTCMDYAMARSLPPNIEPPSSPIQEASPPITSRETNPPTSGPKHEFHSPALGAMSRLAAAARRRLQLTDAQLALVNSDTKWEDAAKDRRSPIDSVAKHLRFKERVREFLAQVGETVRKKEEQVDLEEQKLVDSTERTEITETYEPSKMSLRAFVGELRSMEVIQHVCRLSDEFLMESASLTSLPSTPGRGGDM